MTYPHPLLFHLLLVHAAVAAATTCAWTVKEIPRIAADSIDSVQDFWDNYSDVPVILTGIAESDVNFFDFLYEKCPSATIPLKRFTSDFGEEWGDLEDAGEMELEEFIRYIENLAQGDTVEDVNKTYGFDMILSEECPALLEQMRIPRFFNECLLQSDFVGRQFRGEDDEDGDAMPFGWPTLMMGPQGTGSAMHRDAEGLPFWMTVLEGTKHWRVLPYGANFT
jgi:hypothetical protein